MSLLDVNQLLNDDIDQEFLETLFNKSYWMEGLYVYTLEMDNDVRCSVKYDENEKILYIQNASERIFPFVVKHYITDITKKSEILYFLSKYHIDKFTIHNHSTYSFIINKICNKYERHKQYYVMSAKTYKY